MPQSPKPPGLEAPLGVADDNYYTLVSIIDFVVANGDPAYLFDGIAIQSSSTWANWTTGQYVELETDGTYDFYRRGTTSYKHLNAPFTILKWDGSGYNEDYSSYQVASEQNNEYYWSQFIDSLPAGRYRFEATGGRLDTEWWLSDSSIPIYDYTAWDASRGSGNYSESQTRFEATDSIINNYIYCTGILRNTGKYYFELQTLTTSTPSFGLINTDLFDLTGRTYNSPDGITLNGATIWNNALSETYGEAYAINDIMGVACDFDTGELYFYRNNIPLGLAPYSLNLIKDLPCSPFVSCFSSIARPEVKLFLTPSTLNYTPPSGFTAWVGDAPAPAGGGIFLGSTELTAIKLGTTDVNKVYLGDILIFENIT